MKDKNNDHGFCITCKCGHTDSWEKFEKSASGIDILKGYQCPSCHIAWMLKSDGKSKTLPNGFVIPAKLSIVEIERTL